MKKIAYITIIIFSVLAFNSCKDQNLTPVTDINLISFEVLPTIVVEQGATVSVDVHLYASQVSGKDRTFSVEVDQEATTTDAANYSVPSGTITIPANSNNGSLTITITDNGLGVDAETLVLKVISDSEDLILGNGETTLTIQKFCPFDIDNFVGIYTYTSEMFEASWEVDVQKVDDHTLLVKDMVEDGKDVLIVLDESSLGASVAKQPVWTHSTYGIASFEGAGFFSPCTYIIELDLELTVSAGSFGTAHEVLVKK